MALYAYRCPSCPEFEASFPMGQAPAATECPQCAEPARRRLSVPRLSSGSTAARRLVESTERSAEHPDVVQTVPNLGGNCPAPRSTNPLHRKLPRP